MPSDLAAARAISAASSSSASAPSAPLPLGDAHGLLDEAVKSGVPWESAAAAAAVGSATGGTTWCGGAPCGTPPPAASGPASKERLPGMRPRTGSGSTAATPPATQAMANLADGIQGLVNHLRSEQKLMRDWAESQAQQNARIEQLLERLNTALEQEDR